MKELLLVGAGSLVGGVFRYYLSGIVIQNLSAARFPVGTFTVNLIGCFLIGLFAGLSETHHFFTPQLRLFLITGLLGGFTTFSAFGYETIYLARTGSIELALLNIGLSVIVCLAAVWVGLRIAQAI